MSTDEIQVKSTTTNKELNALMRWRRLTKRQYKLNPNLDELNKFSRTQDTRKRRKKKFIYIYNAKATQR